MSTADLRTCIDLFAGAGGVTAGLKAAELDVRAAVEINPVFSASYRANHGEVNLLVDDLLHVEPQRLLQAARLEVGELGLLSACAPCQGYSSLGKRNTDDPRNDLVLRVLAFVEYMRPRTVAFENVPRLASDHRFTAFVARLHELGYGVQWWFVDAADFGVPQRRRRLILVAVLGIPDEDIPNPSGVKLPQELAEYGTVRDAFTDLHSIDWNDPLHVTPIHPQAVLDRIRAIPKDGGSRKDLPPELRLACHERVGSNATSAYGRMRWDAVAPTMTTRCASPSCGRFIHPEEDRAITLREAAILQTFPKRYEFVGGRMSIEAQIGNAVPVRLACAVACLHRVVWSGVV